MLYTLQMKKIFVKLQLGIGLPRQYSPLYFYRAANVALVACIRLQRLMPLFRAYFLLSIFTLFCWSSSTIFLSSFTLAFLMR